MTSPALQAPRHQRLVIVASVIAGVIGATTVTPEIVTQFWIALGPIALFGLAHGGADPWLLHLIGRMRGWRAVLWFGAYVALAAAFVIVVLWQPVLALGLFLLLSIWHFGRSDAPFQGFGRGSAAIWLAGSIPIIGPMFGHPGQTGQLFAWLLGTNTATVIEIVTWLGPVLMLAWIIGFGMVWLQTGLNGDYRGILELLALAAAMILLAPIIAFTFYFCVVHSTRHFMEILATSAPLSRPRQAWLFLLRQAAPATVIAIAMGTIAWWFLGSNRALPDMTADAVRVLFWGLAALTVPHVMVVERWWEPKQPTAAERKPHV